MRLCRLLIACSILLAPQVQAQDLQTRNYTASDGLPGHEIEAVGQLPSGTMVFLTRRGLALYDGAHWTTEMPFAPTPLVPWRMAIGKNEDIWILIGHECWRRSNGNWELVTSAPVESRVSSHLLHLPHDEGRWRLAIIAQDSKVHLFDGSSWDAIELDAPAARLSAMAMVNGRCILGAKTGLIEIDFETGKSKAWELALPSTDLLSMTWDPIPDRLWILGKDGWIAFVDEAGAARPGSIHTFDVPLDVNPAAYLPSHNQGINTRWAPTWDFPCAPDLAGGLFFGSRFRIAYFHPRIGFEVLSERSGLTAKGMTSTIRDHEGNIWICGVRGASKITSHRIRSYSHREGLFDDEVSATLERSDGTIVLGHGGGITLLNPEFGRPSSETPQKLFLAADRVLERVMDLTEDSNGQLWFAGGSMGLGRIGHDSVTLLPTPSNEAISSVVACEDVARLYVASEHHLYSVEGQKWTRVPMPPHLKKLQTRKLYLDADNILYIATSTHGIVQLSEGKTTQWTNPDPQINSTYTVISDANGKLWVGTRNGLATLEEDGRLARVEAVPVRRPIYALVEDLEGRLWLGSDIGVHSWDGIEFESFSMADGLIGQEANRSAAMVTRDGRIWFGCDRGISVIDNRFDVPGLNGPRIELESLEAGGKRYGLEEHQVIAHDRRELIFRFKAFSFVDEDRVLIEARLDGWDTDWRQPETNTARQLRFNNLLAGDYRLLLRATDVRGMKSPVISSSVITIEGPFWTRGWFVLSSALLALLILGGATSLVVQRRYASRLRREVVEQTSEIRQMEREQERLLRLESLGLLAGGIAHDFNNLLTTITGNASLLANDNSGPAWQRDAVEDIASASAKAAELASSLLTFSRGGAPIKEIAAVDSVIQESVRFGLLGSNIRAKVSIPDNLDPVALDTGQFSQVMNNLIINARQAMTTGGEIRVRAMNDGDSPTNRNIVIEVEDDGPGIDPNTLDRIFDPYFTTKDDGHGLGLATARSIIERHGGSLTAQSTLGEGATFRISLPSTDIQTGQNLPDSATADTTTLELQMRVLVMDDQQAIRKITRSILERLGCTIIEARDGRQAVEEYQKALDNRQPFDAVLMDLTVPGGMGGVEATALICAMDENARIIAMSGYAQNDFMARYEHYGFSARLRKPFDGQELRRAISAAAGEKPCI